MPHPKPTDNFSQHYKYRTSSERILIDEGLHIDIFMDLSGFILQSLTRTIHGYRSGTIPKQCLQCFQSEYYDELYNALTRSLIGSKECIPSHLYLEKGYATE